MFLFRNANKIVFISWWLLELLKNYMHLMIMKKSVRKM